GKPQCLRPGRAAGHAAGDASADRPADGAGDLRCPRPVEPSLTIRQARSGPRRATRRNISPRLSRYGNQMKERARTPLSAVAFLAAVVLRASAGAAGGQSAPAPLARGWGWLLASGIASAVDLADRTVTVAVTGEGQAAIFEGGANWRLRPVSGTEVVHLLPAAVIADADREPVAL